MLEMTYFVDWKLYNSENKGWAYKTELKTTDKDAAVRKYGEMINQYYGKAPYTFGYIVMTDMYGNIVDGNRKYWDNTPAPVSYIEITDIDAVAEDDKTYYVLINGEYIADTGVNVGDRVFGKYIESEPNEE